MTSLFYRLERLEKAIAPPRAFVFVWPHETEEEALSRAGVTKDHAILLTWLSSGEATQASGARQ